MTAGTTDQKRNDRQEIEIEEKIPGPGGMAGNLLARARHGEDFPATTAIAKLIAEIGRPEEASITELANMILQDYGLTSKLLRHLNSVYLKRFGEVTTVSRAIILLGFKQLKDIVLSVSLFEKLQGKNIKPVLNLMAKAIYSGIISNKVAAMLGEEDREEIFVCSVFHRFGEILAAYYMPDNYTKTLGLRDQAGHSRIDRASNEEFCETGVSIALEWQFPSKIVACMKRIRGEDIENAGGSEIDRLRSISTVSNDIAEIMDGAEDNTEKKQKIESLLGGFKGKLGDLVESAEKIVKESTADMQRYCRAYGIKLEESALGKRLLGDPGFDLSLTKPKQADKEDVWRSFSVLDAFSDPEESVETVFAKGMQDVTTAISENFSVNDVFRVILETMYRGLGQLGARRTVFFMKDVKEPKLVVRLALGQTIHKADLSIAIDGKNEDIFSILLKEEKDLFISNTMSEQAAPLMPAWYKSISPEPSFLVLLPIVVNQVSLGFIMIEGPEDQGKNLSKHHLNSARMLLNQIVLAIKYARR